ENQYGVFGYGNLNTIERNSFNSNTEAGIELFSSGGNALVANDFAGNGGGIELGGQVEDTTVSRNRIQGSDEDGIWVSATARSTTIDRNVSDGNRDDGIEVDSTPAELTKN